MGRQLILSTYFHLMNIVVFDIETTGLDRTKHQIIQFAALKIDTETNKILDQLNLYIKPFGEYTISYRKGPGIPGTSYVTLTRNDTKEVIRELPFN